MKVSAITTGHAKLIDYHEHSEPLNRDDQRLLMRLVTKARRPAVLFNSMAFLKMPVLQSLLDWVADNPHISYVAFQQQASNEDRYCLQAPEVALLLQLVRKKANLRGLHLADNLVVEPALQHSLQQLCAHHHIDTSRSYFDYFKHLPRLDMAFAEMTSFMVNKL